jgi:hypothetical protein
MKGRAALEDSDSASCSGGGVTWHLWRLMKEDGGSLVLQGGHRDGFLWGKYSRRAVQGYLLDSISNRTSNHRPRLDLKGDKNQSLFFMI